MPYNGGTTGHPKGVMLTHYNLMAAQVSGQAAFSTLEPGKEVVLAFLPFFHIYGQVVIMLGSLLQGNLLVLFTNPDTEAILAAMERYQATVFYGVPTLYEYLRDHKDLGIHSETVSDNVIPLIEAGVVTGARKNFNPRKVILAFVLNLVFGLES